MDRILCYEAARAVAKIVTANGLKWEGFL